MIPPVIALIIISSSHTVQCFFDLAWACFHSSDSDLAFKRVADSFSPISLLHVINIAHSSHLTSLVCAYVTALLVCRHHKVTLSCFPVRPHGPRLNRTQQISDTDTFVCFQPCSYSPPPTAMLSHPNYQLLTVQPRPSTLSIQLTSSILDITAPRYVRLLGIWCAITSQPYSLQLLVSTYIGTYVCA